MIEEIEYEDKKELIDRESYYIRNLECVNKIIPNRTKKECNKQYYEKNKEKRLKENKKWNQNNKDKIKESNKKYRLNNKDKINLKINCDCGGQYTQSNYARHCKSKKHLQYIEKSNIKL